MTEKTFVRAYVRAAFETATEPWIKSLKAIAARLEKSGDMPALDNAATPFEKKQPMLNAALPPNTPNGVRNFLYSLASKNHVALLPDIVASFDRMMARDGERELATVTSVIELAPDQKAQLEAKLRKQYGEHLEVEYELDPDILGGIIVRVGDRVIDGSVAGKLAALRNTLETAR